MKLKRITSTDYATYGHLLSDDSTQITVTLEPPNRGNQHNVSCIPAGTYTAIRYHSPKRGYDVFMLTGVPNRSAIELHIGNVVEDTHGCVVVGDAFGTIETETGNEAGVVRSKLAFDRLMTLMHGVDSFPFAVLDPDHS